MKIRVQLPDDIAEQPDPGRVALEALAIAGYRSDALTSYQTSRLLGICRLELDGFLKANDVREHSYSVEDLEIDLKNLGSLGDNTRPNAK